jgi:hypothetical protein
MHAALIIFTSSAPVSEFEGPFTEYARALRGVDGLVAKTWIRDGETLGGFHIFTTRAAVHAYLGSEMVAGLTANPAFQGLEIRHYDVLNDLSAITGSPRTSMAA